MSTVECQTNVGESGFTEVREGIWQSPISELLYVERPVWPDDRGFFQEVSRFPEIEDILGRPFVPKQWNHSMSRPGVIRGIHAEGWNKLIYVVTGTAFCAWVDLRQESETFLETTILTLDAYSGAVFVPIGVGNAYGVVGEEFVNYMYVVDQTYNQRDRNWDDFALDPLDRELDIPWPIEDPILSERDTARALSLRELLGKMVVYK